MSFGLFCHLPRGTNPNYRVNDSHEGSRKYPVLDAKLVVHLMNIIKVLRFNSFWNALEF